MQLVLRQESIEDQQAVLLLIESAFRTELYSDHREHLLVDRLRNSDAFIPELSIVAEVDGEIVGHILLTKIRIKNSTASFESLALAPVSVKPGHQKKGIGGRLIREAHRVAEALGFTSVVLLGHENYYPRFGYQPIGAFGIQIPFEAPPENCMAIELVENGLKGVCGTVEYDQAFYE